MLDMGEPVKILDLARDMIRLSGLEEGSDIEIEYTGVRPGEKLYEEMFFKDEVAAPTEHPKILRACNGHSAYCSDQVIDRLTEAAIKGADDACLRHLLGEIVPDFMNGPHLVTEPNGKLADHGTPVDMIVGPTVERPDGRRRAPAAKLGMRVVAKGSDASSAAAAG
jgi:hypothetical protein